MSSVHPIPSFVEWAFGAEFAAKLDAIDAAAKPNPRDAWPDWTDDFRWTPGPAPEPEDTRDHARPSGPSATDDAYRIGFDLGLDREDVSDPSDLGAELVRAFRDGYASGRLEWDRRLDEMCGTAEYSVFSGGISDRDIYRAGATS
jgi:hypothetical protein